MYKSNDFFFEVARGSRPGMTGVVASGSNADIDQAAAEDLAAMGGSLPGIFAAVALEILSGDNTNDKAAGTGALTVTVTGLDAAGAIKTQIATLNGTTAVALTGTWTAVNRIAVATAGSAGTNAGILTVRVASAGATKLTVPIGASVSDGAFYCVPAGYRFVVTAFQLSVSSAGTVTGGLARVTAGGVLLVEPVVQFVLGSSPYRVPLSVPVTFFGGETAKLRVTAVSADNQLVTGTLFGVLMSADAV